MSAAMPPPPPKAVPTLTEVVGYTEAEPAAPPSAPLPLDAPAPRAASVTLLRPVEDLPAEPPAESAVDEAELTQRVLADVQRQIDRMFEFRMRESVGPVFARLLDAFLVETREELNATLRDVVRRAVAQELARQRSR